MPAISPTSSPPPPRTAREQLTAEELAVADRAARRMHDVLRKLLDAVPEEARHASGLARHLGVDRTTCQRAVFVATRPYPGPGLLSRLPGIKGLQQMGVGAKAAKPRISKETIDDLSAAIAQFKVAIQKLGGSQTKLSRRLDASTLGDVESEGEGAERRDDRVSRRRLFEAAAELTGRASECWVAMYVYRPLATKPRTLELVRANGLVGHVARSNAVPLTFHSFSTKSNDPEDATAGVGAMRPLVPSAAGATGPDALIPPFTSSPLPFVTSKQPNEFLVQAIDEHPDSSGGISRPIDLMFGLRNSIPHPALLRPAMEEAWAMINFPCRRLLFDVYLHRDLARACIPSLDAHLWRPDFAQHVGDRWQTRFTDSPTLRLLGPGLRNAASDGWSRHAELADFIFRTATLSPDEYVGYRCEVEYPIWRAGYCISFDFTEAEAGTSG